MENHIIVHHLPPPVGTYFVATLAQHGYLVSATETPAALVQQVERHGPPAMLLRGGDALSEEEETLIHRLAGLGQTRFLAVMVKDNGDEYPASANPIGPLPMAEDPSDETAVPDRSDAVVGERTADKTAEEFWLQADDFITWPTSETEVKIRVHRLLTLPALSQEQRSSSTHVRGGHASIPSIPAMRQRSEQDWRYRLSNIERTIYRSLEQAGGEAVSLAELAECIDAPTQEARIKALRVHISRLRNKIEVDASKPQLILTVRGIGYRLDSRWATAAQP